MSAEKVSWKLIVAMVAMGLLMALNPAVQAFELDKEMNSNNVVNNSDLNREKIKMYNYKSDVNTSGEEIYRYQRKMRIKGYPENVRELMENRRIRAMVENKLSQKEIERLWIKSGGDIEKIKTMIKERYDEINELKKLNWKRRETPMNMMRKYHQKTKEFLQYKREWALKHKYREKYLRQYRYQYIQCDEEGFASEECKYIEANYTEHAKKYILGAIDRAIETLEIVKLRIEASPYLTDEDVNKYVANINNTIQELENFKDEESNKLESCENITCFREVAIEVREKLVKIKNAVRYYIQKERLERMNIVLTRADVIAAQLERMKEIAENKGITISEEVDKAESLIAEAKELREKAYEVLEENKEDTTKLDEVGEYIAESNQKLNEAKRILQQIWNKIVTINKNALE